MSHPGYTKTKKLISDRYVWLNMKKDIKEYVAGCDVCARVKVSRHNEAPLHQFPSVHKRLSSIHIDLVGPLHASLHLGLEYKYLLTVIDRASRWLECIPLTEITVEAVMSSFLFNWIG